MYVSDWGLWRSRVTIQSAGDGVYCAAACPRYSSCLLRAVCDGCLQDRPPLLLSDSLSFTVPGALLVLEALIGPELDCGGPDY